MCLVRTLEHVRLPLESKLAARVEGRSKQARLGMTAHITAPTREMKESRDHSRPRILPNSATRGFENGSGGLS
jgi:hypothetical protein